MNDCVCEKNCLEIGKEAPKFKADAFVKGEFKKISLDDYKGKWVLLFFYPLDFTFVCPTELYKLGEMTDEFEKEGCEILGVSIDSVHSHKAWAEKDTKIGNLGFPLISDLRKSLSKSYNVLHPEGMSLRGSFLIDPDGILQSIVVNNLAVGRNPEELLRVMKAFKTGDLCPVNWEKGNETLGKG